MGTAAAAVAVLALAGCGVSAQDLADQRAKEREARIEALDDAPVWIGTVTGYEGFLEDKVSVDYGGEYDADVKVAYVTELDEYDDCTGPAAEKTASAFIEFIHRAAPVGAKVAVIRVGPDRDGGVILSVTAAGKPDETKASLNERMASAGVALPDPFARDAKSDKATVASQKAELDPDDYAWWAKVVAASAKTAKAGTGLVGQCARALKAEAIADAKASARIEAETRKWELGPDGRKGTSDDYSYGDKRDGSGGGGSVNVPGWLCPTRWC